MNLGKKAKKLCSGILAAVLLLQPLAQPMMLQAAEVPDSTETTTTSGKTYYFSTLKTDSTEDGTQENPYKSLDKIEDLDIQPGDQILLERGSEFNDQYIHLMEKGDSAGEPIIIEPYGDETADRPKINTNGKGVWEQDYGARLDSTAHKRNGDVSSAILLKDTENIEIRGLEITNWVEVEADGKAYNDVNLIDRTGVAGMAQNKGTLEHIVLDDLYIHDIKGNIVNKHMLNGGIYFICALPDSVTGYKDTIAADAVPKFDGLTIENCHLDNVSRWGIAAAYTIYWEKFGAMVIPDDVAKTYGSSNVVIRNNYLNDIGGDAITTMYCYKPVVEGNVSQGAARDIKSSHWPANTGHKVAAGIWPWKCKDSIFQRNECFDMQNYLTGNQDAQAWDADWGDGTIYQYNYSHGNSGGCVMICGAQAYRTTFRYNISQNDLRGLLCIPGNPDLHAYNNTFYVKEGVPVVPNDFGNGVANVENNIFYYAGSTPGNGNWHPANSRVTYDNNLYYNFAAVPEDDKNAIIADGKIIFQNEGTAPAAPQESGDIHELSAFEGYKLAAGSPAIDAGKQIIDDNDYDMAEGYTDFFNNPVDLANPDVGAAQVEESPAPVLRLLSNVYEIQTEGQEGTNTITGLETNTTLETFRKNLIYQEGATITVKSDGTAVEEGTVVKYPMTVDLTIGEQTITYTLIPNTEAKLIDTSFMVKEAEAGNKIYVPHQEKNPCTVETILADVKASRGAVVSVMNGETPVTSGSIADGMSLKITAEDTQTVNTYTITVKNEYHWTRDYVDAQQGNVWFAQSKTGEADYINLTAYDNQWATWNLSGEAYSCVGAEGEKNVVTEATNGLLCDMKADGPTPAMAFRVPMTGKVTFALRDTEPYLRQNGNSGGSLKLSLYVNNETEPRQSCELTVSNQKVDFPVVELNVQKGDFIRLQALAVGSPSKPSAHVTPIITYLDAEYTGEQPEVPTAPSAPTNVTASEITQTSAKLTWTAPANGEVTKYEIYNGDERVKESTETTVVVDGLTANMEYTLTVKAVDAAGNSSEGTDVTFTTLKQEEPTDTQDPEPPTKAWVESITTTSLVVCWIASPSEDVVEYKIFDWYTEEEIIKVSADKTEVLVENLTPGTKFMWAVQAVDANGNESAAVIISMHTLEDTAAEKKQLQALITQAEKKVAENKYTDATVKAVQTQVTTSKNLLKAAAPTKAQLTKAISDLTAAVNGLKEKAENVPTEDVTAEKKQLQALITQAEKKVAENKYTDATVKAVQTQVTTSKNLLKAAAPTKAQLTKAISDLTTAVNGLKEKDTTVTPTSKPWPFEDVEQIANHWKYENIKYVYENEIMNGISGTKKFNPDGNLTRAMFATVLYRMAGQPEIAFTAKFKDVKDGQYYSKAILWANSKGIVDGYTDGNYGVNDNITREQIAKMLNLYAKVQKYDISAKKDLGSFTDIKEVSNWAVGFMQWATAVEMITGKPNDDQKTFRLDPKGQATRAECAKMLTMFMKKYAN